MAPGRYFLVISSLLMGLVLGLGLSAALNWPQRRALTSPQEQEYLNRSLKSDTNLAWNITSVAQKVTPSVVGISVRRYVNINEEMKQARKRFPNLPRDFERQHPRMPKQDFQRHTSGSGVIVSIEDGVAFILTNDHVVRMPDRITVSLLDGREFKGDLLAGDPKTDLALLKIRGEELYPAQMGDSSNLKIGEWVIAIGNPFQLSHTVTAGIVSAKGRSDVNIIDSNYRYEQFIQTDAAINPGNSGGPLVNLKGEVIGINTAIATRSGSYQGVGFAIPINLARKIMKHLREAGEVSRGFLGVGIDQLRPEQIKVLGLKRKSGVMVRGVMPGSPAAMAGMQEGDVIFKFGGDDIFTVDGLRYSVADTLVGAEVDVIVFREGKKLTLKALLIEQPDDSVSLGGLSPGNDDNELGLKVRDVKPEDVKEYGDEGLDGVYVDAVTQRSRADHAGLRKGALIQWMRQGPGKQFKIRNMRDYEVALGQMDLGESVGMTVRLGRETMLIVIE